MYMRAIPGWDAFMSAHDRLPYARVLAVLGCVAIQLWIVVESRVVATIVATEEICSCISHTECQVDLKYAM